MSGLRAKRSGISAKGSGISAVALVSASYVVSSFLSAGASAKAVSRTQTRRRLNRRNRPSAPKPTTSASTSIRRRTARRSPTSAQDDFEILEGGAPQKIEQFEHVLIAGESAAGPAARAEHASTRGAQAAQNPRARVFVLFLDINHVDVDGSHNIRRPLVEALDRLIGPDDLVAVMTPDMSARDITFARKTTTIEGELSTRTGPGASATG